MNDVKFTDLPSIITLDRGDSIHFAHNGNGLKVNCEKSFITFQYNNEPVMQFPAEDIIDILAVILKNQLRRDL